MSKHVGFNAKSIKERTKVIKNLFMSVLAEETSSTEGDGGADDNNTQQAQQTQQTQTVNFEDLVARARKEEKDKLYPQIVALKKEKSDLTEKLNAHLLTITAKDKKIEELEAKLKASEESSSKNDSEEVAGLKKDIKKLEKTIADFEKNAVDVEALENQIKGEYEVKLYREQKLRESTEIIEELVTGTTKEEIDASFEHAKTRYASIKNSVVSTAVDNLPIGNVSQTSLNTKDFSFEDLAKMDVRSPEYKEARKKLGLK